jgi:hypothetical protein
MQDSVFSKTNSMNTPEATQAPEAAPLSLDAAALRLRVDRRTLAKAIDADRFAVPVDHNGHKNSPRYRLNDVCESLAQHRQRSEPRQPELDPEKALSQLADRMAAIACLMDSRSVSLSEAIAELFPRPIEPICPLCGVPHLDMPHPARFLR